MNRREFIAAVLVTVGSRGVAYASPLSLGSVAGAAIIQQVINERTQNGQ